MIAFPNRLEVYEADRKGWRWRLILWGRPVAVSVESYRRKSDAIRGAGRALGHLNWDCPTDVEVVQ